MTGGQAARGDGAVVVPRLVRRPAVMAEGLPSNLHPVLRRVYAARGVGTDADLDLRLDRLHPPRLLRNVGAAAALLAEAIRRRRRIVIAGDYDADGATGTALGVLGLRALGAPAVDYVVPNRFTMGYGLSPALVALAVERGAEVLVTVDNGIASHAGVAAAKAAGLTVIVTDHHLPGATLPAADAIVNPNQPGCDFPSKHLAGVGVMFYLLCALRALRRGECGAATEPRLADFLDLVALGTVADVVRLDHNNRILVAQGLARMRAGRMRPGLAALLAAAGRTPERLTAADLGFALGPRLNAAGRLDDMRLGIECLLASDESSAAPLAATLDRLNRERREIEGQMREEALASLEYSGGEAVGVCVFDPGWHEGVVGLVAARVRERLHRPVLAFAPAAEAGAIKGSGRSIPGLHLRDALAEIDAAQPGLIQRFGGHAMAAGVSLAGADLPVFARAFDSVCRRRLDAGQLEAVLESDGELADEELNLDTARALEEAGPWGQGFPEPMFDGRFEVLSARAVGGEGLHWRYRLRSADGAIVGAVDFGGAQRVVERGAVSLAYQLTVNRYQGSEAPELRIRGLWPA